MPSSPSMPTFSLPSGATQPPQHSAGANAAAPDRPARMAPVRPSTAPQLRHQRSALAALMTAERQKARASEKGGAPAPPCVRRALSTMSLRASPTSTHQGSHAEEAGASTYDRSAIRRTVLAENNRSIINRTVERAEFTRLQKKNAQSPSASRRTEAELFEEAVRCAVTPDARKFLYQHSKDHGHGELVAHLIALAKLCEYRRIQLMDALTPPSMLQQRQARRERDLRRRELDKTLDEARRKRDGRSAPLAPERNARAASTDLDSLVFAPRPDSVDASDSDEQTAQAPLSGEQLLDRLPDNVRQSLERLSADIVSLGLDNALREPGSQPALVFLKRLYEADSEKQATMKSAAPAGAAGHRPAHPT